MLKMKIEKRFLIAWVNKILTQQNLYFLISKNVMGTLEMLKLRYGQWSYLAYFQFFF
jgi:hypothetical protein